VGAEVEHHLLLTFAEHHGVRKRGKTGTNFDRPTTSIIKNTKFEAPSVRIPCPARDRVVDESSPEEQPDTEWQEPASFGNGAGNNGCGDGAEL